MPTRMKLPWKRSRSSAKRSGATNNRPYLVPVRRVLESLKPLPPPRRTRPEELMCMTTNRTDHLQTEFEFTLPKGYLGAEGKIQREGRMRLSTAMDEIVPLRDPRVKNNEA